MYLGDVQAVQHGKDCMGRAAQPLFPAHIEGCAAGHHQIGFSVQDGGRCAVQAGQHLPDQVRYPRLCIVGPQQPLPQVDAVVPDDKPMAMLHLGDQAAQGLQALARIR